jgi:hypothetical protein
VARKPNYDFEKRRKELDRKAKKDARREEKQARKESGEESGGGPPIASLESLGFEPRVIPEGE